MSEINAAPDSTPPSVPAGWYPDPSGLPQQRWWNGQQWTHDVSSIKQDLSRLPAPRAGSYSQPQAVPQTAVVQQALPASTPATAGAFPTRRQLRQQLEEEARQAASAPHPGAPFAMPALEPTSAEPADSVRAMEPSPGIVTGSATVISAGTVTSPETTASFETTLSPEAAVASPDVATGQFGLGLPAITTTSGGTPWPFQTEALPEVEAQHSVPYQPFGMIPKISAGLAEAPEKADTVSVWIIASTPLLIVGVGVLAVTTVGEFYSRFMQGGLVFIFLLATIALAVRDRRELTIAGHEKTASPAWVLLTPLAYLIVRTVAVHKATGRGSAPLFVWLLLVAATVAAAFLLPEWLERIVTATSVF